MLLRVADHLFHALEGEDHARANAVKVYLCAGRSSSALMQHAHGNAVGRRRPIEYEGVCHADVQVQRKPRSRRGLQLLRLLAHLLDFPRRQFPGEASKPVS